MTLLTLQCFDLYHCLTNINKLKKSGHRHTYLCTTLQLTIQGVFPYWVYDLFVYPCHTKRLSVHQLLCVSSDPLVIWARSGDKVILHHRHTAKTQIRLTFTQVDLHLPYLHEQIWIIYLLALYQSAHILWLIRIIMLLPCTCYVTLYPMSCFNCRYSMEHGC